MVRLLPQCDPGDQGAALWGISGNRQLRCAFATSIGKRLLLRDLEASSLTFVRGHPAPQSLASRSTRREICGGLMITIVRRTWLATVVAGAGLFVAPAAFAADMPVKAPVYRAPPIAVFNWTGCFVGGHVGGLWARKDWSSAAGLSLGGHDVNGWLGGVQAGCDYQLASNFVIGIQGDHAWVDADGSHFFAPDGFTDRSRIKSLASVTGRIGYAWDRFLGYVKGGVAWERDAYEVFDNLNNLLFTASETRTGWTVGVGGEYAFTNYLSGFVEYNYYDFGSSRVTFTTGPFDINIKEHKSVVKAGLNFRFGGWTAPVAARF
jgi:outer membrane immunogenic protein